MLPAGGRVVVIGAGASGLVAVKTLAACGYAVTCLEANPTLGGAFVTKAYDDAQLVSSRFITPFSDFRMPPGTKDHPTLPEYVAYLEDYAVHFSLAPMIRFGCKVDRVVRTDVGYTVAFAGETISCGAVCVCSGLHNVASVPSLPGFTGTALHSSQYKAQSIFAGKRVLVVGCGETGLDMVHRAVLAPAIACTLLVRRGFVSVPAGGAGVGVPLDSMITNLFESSYVHPWLEWSRLRWVVTTHAIRLGFGLATGTRCGFNQWAGGFPPHQVKRGHHIINKSTKAMPYINQPIKRQSWLGRTLWAWADKWQCDGVQPPTGLDVDVVRGGIRCADGKTITFDDGTQAVYDLVLFATGYKQTFPFLRAQTASAADDLDDLLPNEHNICFTADPTLAYVGFVRPNVGAIPPMSEMQVFWWIERLRGHIASPTTPPRYRLLGGTSRTAAYACDYGLYMHELGSDIGAVPDVWCWLFKSWRTAVAYSMGQAYITFFRLDGPFADPSAVRISETELYAPVTNRAVASNVLFGGLAAIFGFLSLVCWVVERVLIWAVGVYAVLANHAHRHIVP